MISRRHVIIGAAAAGIAAATRRATPVQATSQPGTPVRVAVPPGACDCHAHIFGDPGRFPFAPGRTYTPPPAPVDKLLALHRALQIDRVVIVQASVYSTDNACTLDALKQLGPRARAIAVIDDTTTEAALDEMARAGVRGIRVNLETAGQRDPALARQRLQAAVKRVTDRNWHIQIYARLSVIAAIANDIMTATVPLVFDHFGGAQGAAGVGQAGFDVLVNLVRTSQAYVKISGAYRGSAQGPDYPDMAPLAKALIAANPQRILWGTDWPHTDSSQVPGRQATDIAPPLSIDDGRLLSQFALWAPDPAQQKMILVDNPAKLYGF